MLDLLLHNCMLRYEDEPARIAASLLPILGISSAVAEAEEETFVVAINSSTLMKIELMPSAGELANGLMECLTFLSSVSE